MNPTELKSRIEKLGELVRETTKGRQLYYSKMQSDGFCIAFTPSRDKKRDTEIRDMLEQCLENAVRKANKKECGGGKELYSLKSDRNKNTLPYVQTAKYFQIPLATFVYSKNVILLQVMREEYFEPVIFNEIYSALEKFCLSEA